MDKPTPDSYWVIPGRFMAGEYPGDKSEEKALSKARRFIQAGINTFIDLTEEGEYNLRPYLPFMQAAAREAGQAVEHKRFPIKDLHVPEPAYMRSILKAIQEYLDDGRVVYVHCYGGIGRTGTTVGCYLVDQGMGGKAAITQISEWRQDTPDADKISPETDAQRELILAWRK